MVGAVGCAAQVTVEVPVAMEVMVVVVEVVEVSVTVSVVGTETVVLTVAVGLIYDEQKELAPWALPSFRSSRKMGSALQAWAKRRTLASWWLFFKHSVCRVDLQPAPFPLP